MGPQLALGMAIRHWFGLSAQVIAIRPLVASVQPPDPATMPGSKGSPPLGPRRRESLVEWAVMSMPLPGQLLASIRESTLRYSLTGAGELESLA